MAGVAATRLITALEKLKVEMDAGNLKHGEYDQRLARIIGELRDQGISADRPQLQAAIDNAAQRGVIPPSVKSHLEKKLGLSQ
jgi:hypothetical protein